MTNTTRNGAAPESRSITELVNDATAQMSRLIRDELQLARLEMQRKGRGYGLGAGLAGLGALLAFYGGAALTAAAVLGLATALPDWAAALIIGAALLVVAGILVLSGKKSVEQASPPVPEEAAAGVKRDIEVVQEGRRG